MTSPTVQALVAAATRAANPHNSQPWWFEVDDAQIDVVADLERRTGALDPLDRELQIGLGCAIENITVAAPAHGLRADVELLPDPARPELVAEIRLTPGPTVASMEAEAIARRRTDRAPFGDLPVGAETLVELARNVEELPGVRLTWIVEEHERAAFGDLIVQAAHAVAEDEEQSRASYKLVGPEGLTLAAQDLPWTLRAAAKVLPVSRARADATWLKRTRRVHTHTAAAYGVISVPDASDPRHRLRGGRALERVHLDATVLHLALQPMNQPTERADRERQLGLEPRFTEALRAYAPAGTEVLTTFRIGHPCRPGQQRAQSPRRPVADVIRERAPRAPSGSARSRPASRT